MKTILLALAGVVFLNAAHAKEQCSNAILNGTYSLYATGSIVGVGPVGLVAVLKYDGRGTFSAIVFQKVNGNSVQFTLTGTYSVDANCILTDQSVTSTGQTGSHTAVIAAGGNEFYSLNTTAAPPNVIVGIAKKQFPGSED
jgi:hypothetical protein